MPILYTVLEGKSAEKKRFKGSLIRLSEKSALMVLDEPLEPMTNLKINLGDVEDRLAGYDFYGKIIERAGDKGLTHELRFTSVPPEIDAYFKAHLRYAQKAGTNREWIDD